MNLKTNYKTIKNEEKQGIELYFESIPTFLERKELKENGYKWNNLKKCWYKKENANVKPKKENVAEHSLKVGDILYSSWGYEQTNNTFFRVEKLVGKTMVTLREVFLGIKDSEATGIDAEDRCYDTSVWSYNENEPEEITRKVKNYYKEKEPEYDFVAINSFMSAHKYNGQKLYCSWYY